MSCPTRSAHMKFPRNPLNGDVTPRDLNGTSSTAFRPANNRLRTAPLTRTKTSFPATPALPGNRVSNPNAYEKITNGVLLFDPAHDNEPRPRPPNPKHGLQDSTKKIGARGGVYDILGNNSDTWRPGNVSGRFMVNKSSGGETVLCDAA